jgi:long-chain acyl-CoA synthetase
MARSIGGKREIYCIGGAALQPRIARVFGVAGVWVLEGYGLTETSPVIAVNNPLERKMKIGTVGPVLHGNEVKIDEDGEI